MMPGGGASSGKPPSAAQKLDNALSDYDTRRYMIDNRAFQLDKSGMRHILERHAPEYWNGETKRTQTFLPRGTTTAQIQQMVGDVLGQNRDAIIAEPSESDWDLFGTSGGVRYNVTTYQGRVARLVPAAVRRSEMAEHEMLSVVTCAKQDGRFIPLDELTELKLRNPPYVDGSVRVTVRGEPFITDAEWTDVVEWWVGMGRVLRDLSNGARQSVGYFDWPGSILFEVEGERLTWTLRGPEVISATLDRVLALRTLVRDHTTSARLARDAICGPPGEVGA